MVNRKLGVARVMDLSATPFFLSGSGYAEGTLFPWTMSDFSLMDAIECGIVKLPRVPVADNIPGEEMPMFRNLWENIRKDMPKKGRGKGDDLDPLKLPDAAADGSRGALRPLREDFQAMGGGRDQGSALLHRGLQQHIHLQAGLRLHLRLPAARMRTARPPSRMGASRSSAISMSTAIRLPGRTRFSSTASNSNPARRWMTSSVSMAADEIERFRREIMERTGDCQDRRKTSPIRNCSARS